MQTVISKDGTTIAFERAGSGPALILVGGMFEQRAMESETAHLAAFPLLRQHFTVFHYDRRGRGDSMPPQAGRSCASRCNGNRGSLPSRSRPPPKRPLLRRGS